MLVLLTGAAGLSGYPISRVAMARSVSVYAVLDRLENRGWVIGEWEDRPDGVLGNRRRLYRLTPEGRTAVMELLGLKENGE
jgi:PadR family transcriptional regulator, regulatory protein PadR